MERTDRPAAPSRSDAAIACLLFLAALAYFSLSWGRTIETRDEGYLLSQSARVAAGEVPHRDFVDVYGPGVLTVTGWMLDRFEGRILSIRVGLGVLKAGAVALAFLITRQLVPWPFAIFGAVLAMAYWGRVSINLNAPYAALYTVPICQLALLLLILAEGRRRTLGYMLAGGVSALAVLFKQSLGAFMAYGMVLTLWSVGMLTEPQGRKVVLETRVALGIWLIAAIAFVIPTLSFLRSSDYLFHFLPIHALMGLVALGVVRQGGSGSIALILKRRLLPWALGASVPLAATLLVYAYWGALARLISDMFVLPTTLVNYYVPARLPPQGLALFALGAAAAIAAVLLGLRGIRREAAWLGLTGMVLLLLGGTAVAEATASTDPIRVLRYGSRHLMDVQLAAIGWAAVGTFAWWLLRPQSGPLRRDADVFVALTFFHLFLCFEVFPRAWTNFFLIEGAQMILLTALLFVWYRTAAGEGAPRYAKALAAILLTAAPLSLVTPVVADVVSRGGADGPERALRLAGAEGISLPFRWIDEMHLDDMERLMEELQSSEPRDAPILVLSNEEMIVFLSGRKPLYPDTRAELFWIGWGMLPDPRIRELDVDGMIRRLRQTPETIVIDRSDDSARRLREALPALRKFIDQNYEVRRRIGVYRVLASRAHARGGAVVPKDP
jgi:hypothetical protein